jgi:hypothetical protein
MRRSFGLQHAACCAAVLGMLCGLGSPAKAASEAAVPWLDLVDECQYLVIAKVVSFHQPGPRFERGVLEVEEALIGQPPRRLVMRLPTLPFAGRAIDPRLMGLATHDAWRAGSVGGAPEAPVWRRGRRVVAFVETHPDFGRRFAPVRGDAADRHLVSTLLAAGDRLDLATALPALRRTDEAPTEALLDSALAELDRRVGPADAELLTDLVCSAPDYPPAVQREALRWAGRLQVSAAQPCVERAASRSLDPTVRIIAADALAELGSPYTP